jgi:RNA polymerase sigma factor (sigma-70 family)
LISVPATKEILMTTEETVTALVAAARDGDNAAWGRLMDRYVPLAVSVARRFRLSPDEVKDVTGTVWLRLVEHLDHIREPQALPGWIATTTRNESLRFLRSRNRTLPVDPQNAPELEGEDQVDVDAELLQAERRQALRDALEELRPQHRELLLLLLADPPLSYDEISEKLDIPKGSIGPTRARALEQLRKTNALSAFVATTDSVTDRS